MRKLILVIVLALSFGLSAFAAGEVVCTPVPSEVMADSLQDFTFHFRVPDGSLTWTGGSIGVYFRTDNFGGPVSYDNVSVTVVGCTFTGWTTDGASVTITGIDADGAVNLLDVRWMGRTAPSTAGEFQAFTFKYALTDAEPVSAGDNAPAILVLTPTATETHTETETFTPTETSTPTETATPTETETATITETITQTITETITETVTATITQTITETVTQTVTQTITQVVSVLGSNLETRNLLIGGSGLELISATGVELAGILITSTDCTSATLTAYAAASIGTTTTANYRFQLPVHDCGNLPKFVPFTTPWMVGITPKQWYYDFPAGMVISRDGGTMEAVIFYRRK